MWRLTATVAAALLLAGCASTAGADRDTHGSAPTTPSPGTAAQAMAAALAFAAHSDPEVGVWMAMPSCRWRSSGVSSPLTLPAGSRSVRQSADPAVLVIGACRHPRCLPRSHRVLCPRPRRRASPASAGVVAAGRHPAAAGRPARHGHGAQLRARSPAGPGHGAVGRHTRQADRNRQALNPHASSSPAVLGAGIHPGNLALFTRVFLLLAIATTVLPPSSGRGRHGVCPLGQQAPALTAVLAAAALLVLAAGPALAASRSPRSAATRSPTPPASTAPRSSPTPSPSATPS